MIVSQKLLQVVKQAGIEFIDIFVAMFTHRRQKTFVPVFLAVAVTAFDDAVRIEDECIAGLEGDKLLGQRRAESVRTIEAEAKTGCPHESSGSVERSEERRVGKDGKEA